MAQRPRSCRPTSSRPSSRSPPPHETIAPRGAVGPSRLDPRTTLTIPDGPIARRRTAPIARAYLHGTRYEGAGDGEEAAVPPNQALRKSEEPVIATTRSIGPGSCSLPHGLEALVDVAGAVRHGAVVRVQQRLERVVDFAVTGVGGTVLGEHPLAHRAHVAVPVVGDEQEPGQQDLGLRQPEVHAALDATSGRCVAEGSGRPLRTGHRSRLLQR